MSEDTLAALFADPPMGPAATLTYRTGTILTWDPLTAENTVQVDNTVMTNLAIQNSSEVQTLTNGARVAILCARYPSGLSSFSIMGRIIRPGTDETSQLISSLSAGSFSVDSVPDTDTTDQFPWIDLLHYGPELTVMVGNSGRLVTIHGYFAGTGADGFGGGGYMGLQLGGANTRAADYDVSAGLKAQNLADTQVINASVSRAVLHEDLSPGATIITAKYGVDAGVDTDFADRWLIAITL